MSHSHGHAGGRHRWRLTAAFVGVGSFFVVELIVGLLSGSLALLSDAGHMAADVVTLVATKVATRKDTSGRRTYGSYRAEVFASGLAVLLMLGVGVYIGIEAVVRIGQTPTVATGPMLVVGVIGLVVNVMSLLLLRGGASESLNVRGAYFEVVADTIGSLGVIAAALLIGWTGYAWWDTVIAVSIMVFVLVRALSLGREVLAVLGQHAPSGVEPIEILHALRELPEVSDVHDLHVWTLTSGMDVATAHLVTTGDSAAVLGAAAGVLRERFSIAHATLQVEAPANPTCQGADW